MGIGLGIVLVLAGLVLVTGVVNYDISFIEGQTLGWILLMMGALALVFALVMNQQRSRATQRSRSAAFGIDRSVLAPVTV